MLALRFHCLLQVMIIFVSLVSLDYCMTFIIWHEKILGYVRTLHKR
jgi:hypothetical protein